MIYEVDLCFYICVRYMFYFLIFDKSGNYTYIDRRKIHSLISLFPTCHVRDLSGRRLCGSYQDITICVWAKVVSE